MKKGIGFILCCAAGLMLGSCGADKEFVLTGRLDNCSSDALVLRCMDAGICDTIPVAADGSFAYRRHVGEACEGFVTEAGDDGRFFAFLYVVDGTSTHIEADASDFDSTVITGDLEEAYRVGRRLALMMRSCSEERQYDSFREMEDEWHLLRDTLDRESAAVGIGGFAKIMRDNYSSFHTSVVLDYANSLTSRGRDADSDADLNAYMEHFDWNASNYYLTQVLHWHEACAGRADNPSYVNMIGMAADRMKNREALEKLTMDMMSSYFASGADTHIDEVCAEALKHVQNEKARQWIENYNDKLKRVVPGAEATDCLLETPDGATLHLSDLYGRVLFIDVWATWCGPCCAEIPHLERLVERMRADNRVRFVSISVDRNRTAWEKKLADDKPQWEQYRCVDFCELYGIAGIPCFMMIDRDGRIVTMQAPRPSDDGVDSFIKSQL